MFHALLAVVAAQAAPLPAERTAAGTFDVKISDEAGPTPPIAAIGLAKVYQGDLAAIGTRRMLGAGDPASGTASYVVLEQVAGTLGGRKGGFLLQHHGWMHAGEQRMAVAIAPGSGTGELAGIAGRMDIAIEGRLHRYVLHYTLPG